MCVHAVCTCTHPAKQGQGLRLLPCLHPNEPPSGRQERETELVMLKHTTSKTKIPAREFVRESLIGEKMQAGVCRVLWGQEKHGRENE